MLRCELGMENCRSVSTPLCATVEKEAYRSDRPEVSAELATKHRAAVARVVYLAQDRLDLGVAAVELAKTMAIPREGTASADSVVALHFAIPKGRASTAEFATAAAAVLVVPPALDHGDAASKTVRLRILSWYCTVRSQEAELHLRLLCSCSCSCSRSCSCSCCRCRCRCRRRCSSFFFLARVHENEVSSLMRRRELCKAGRANKRTMRWGEKVGATGLQEVAGLHESTRAQTRSSPPGETAEEPPEKHRDKPSSHTNLAGCGGETDTSRRWVPARVAGWSRLMGSPCSCLCRNVKR